MENQILKYKRNSILGNIGGIPLCQEYKSAWRKCGNDKEMMVRLALSQQSIPHFSTACYKDLGLTKEYILREFGDYINGKKVFEDVEGVSGYTYELYVGYGEPIEVRTDVISMMWHVGDVSIQTTKCPTLYVSNKSSVNVTLKGYNSIRVYLFDESSVNIVHADDESSVLVYKYSDAANVSVGEDCLAEVKQYNKTLRL